MGIDSSTGKSKVESSSILPDVTMTNIRIDASPNATVGGWLTFYGDMSNIGKASVVRADGRPTIDYSLEMAGKDGSGSVTVVSSRSIGTNSGMYLDIGEKKEIYRTYQVQDSAKGKDLSFRLCGEKLSDGFGGVGELSANNNCTEWRNVSVSSTGNVLVR